MRRELSGIERADIPFTRRPVHGAATKRGQVKATTLLKRQHNKVKAIFKKLEGGHAAPAPLLEELANDLAAHMAI